MKIPKEPLIGIIVFSLIFGIFIFMNSKKPYDEKQANSLRMASYVLIATGVIASGVLFFMMKQKKGGSSLTSPEADDALTNDPAS